MKYAKLIALAGVLFTCALPPISASGSPLGAFCGGFIGIPCDPGLFCEFPTGTCGRADMGGKCASLHLADRCNTALVPVCGCDGRTYRNDCLREGAGVSKLHDGRCRPGPYSPR
jgi:hypothetical protein